MICLVRRRRLEKKREEGLAPTEGGMPTSEEELAKKTEEGCPETQGKLREVRGTAAGNTSLKGEMSSVSGTAERLKKFPSSSSPGRGDQKSLGELSTWTPPSPLFLSGCTPILHCVCLCPPGSACPTKSLRGMWSEEFRHGGIPG